jgi:hypothetical protein
MSRSTAEIVSEYGPFSGADSVHGVTYDGQNVWFAAGDKLIAFDPASGRTLRSIDVSAHAGTAFDGSLQEPVALLIKLEGVACRVTLPRV